ncbi:MAG: hypothetical protein K6T51_12835 [Rubrobacteraceae bacterium]|uniref:hypothetical protein n=1 Tax=Rubrobacter naiadicus TaxID=1392641 RepID=UPI002360DBB2|nr:hypothetical protein [Rubrobacter naiadicus]MBX6762384.1 hypothetical protein [Rubrobacteraceae bacterium]MCL6439486.1 hypothetical protein [Rubrobacteraceae bacterium]
MGPRGLLSLFAALVPLLVALAGVASFFLLRAGYGILVGGLVPFAGLLLMVVLLGLLFARAAGRGGRG